MKYVRIFFLHFQDAIDARSRMVVWFLISLINPMVYLLFWRGAYTTLGQSSEWQMSSFASYYFLLVIASSFLLVHIEEYIAYFDIERGYLANSLLKPVSYFWYNFFHELPYRIIQGSFGILAFLFFFFAYPGLIQLHQNIETLLLSIVLILGAYVLSFLFKIILGISALFTTDFTGLSELLGVLILIFGGFIIPLDLFPQQFTQIIFFLPFPYMFYYPVIAIAGRLEVPGLVRVISIQGLWIIGFTLFYKFVWNKGIKLFTAVGR